MNANDSDLPLAGMSVLVVEDEYFLASALIGDLRDVRAVPLGPSATVADALKRISEAIRIDAAVLNFRLRGETSAPVAEELSRRDIPFVFVTGNDEEVRALFPNAPVHMKPADMPKLVLTLEALIAERAKGQ